jgi:hypothetical protein
MFDVPLEGESPDAPAPAERLARADLLLEIAPVTGAPEMLSGSITGHGPRSNARVWVMPLLTGSASARPGKAEEHELASALRAMRRDPSLRLAITGAWAGAIDAAGHAAQRQVLAGSGQLELLAAPMEGAAASAAAATLFPPRTAWIESISGGSLSALARDLPASVRYLLLTASDAASIRAAAEAHTSGDGNESEEGYVAVLEPAPQAPLSSAVPVRLVSSPSIEPAPRMITACICSASHAQFHALDVADVQRVTHIDALLEQTIALAPPALDSRHGVAPAGWFVPLGDAGQLTALRASVRRWNRHYASPRLLFATPVDYFTALDELELHGRLALPRINLA